MKCSNFLKFFALSVCAYAFSGCSDDQKNEPLPDPEPTPEEPAEVIIDLSKDGLANCYIVTSPGKYKFPADNQFNLGEGLPVPPQISPTAAGLIWQSAPDLISSVELIDEGENPEVTFEVKNTSGNALIAVYNEEGRIEWSWHIWMPETQVYSVFSTSGYEVMNMNLGALSDQPGDVASYGMLYQWGRKDPFPAAGTLTGNTSTVSASVYDIDGNLLSFSNSSWYDSNANTLEYSIANPMVCLSNYSQYSVCRDWLRAELSDDSLWGNPNGEERDRITNEYIYKGVKTCYDPSPSGWRIAPPDAFRDFSSTGGYVWTLADFNVADINSDGRTDLDDYNYGWHFNVNESEPLYFPAAARFDGSYAMLMGSMSGLWGNYWSNAPVSSMAGGAFVALSFQIKDMNGNDMVTLSPSASSSRADAFSIRCIRD